MATERIARAVLELSTDSSTFKRDITAVQREIETFKRSVENAGKSRVGVFFRDIGKDLQGLRGWLDKGSEGFDQIGGSALPIAGILGNVAGGISRTVGGFSALGPVAGAVALGLGAVAAGATAVVAGAALATAEIIDLTKHAANAGDELLKLSNQTGLGVEALSKFKFIAEQTDTPLETITRNIQKLGQNLAENSPKTVKAISAIGLSVQDIRKQKPDEAFTTIIAAIGKIPDAGQRAAAGAAIFGKQFREISQLTREDLKKLGEEAETLGLVFTEEFAVAGDRFNDALGAIGGGVDALKLRLGAEFLPVAIAFVETFKGAFVQALHEAGAESVDFASLVADASLLVGQALAKIVEVGAPVVKWLVEFFAGKFIAHLGLLDLFASVLNAIGKVAGVVSTISPELGIVAVGAQQAATQLHRFAESGVVGTARVAGQIGEYADAVEAAAAKTGRELPAAVAKVKAEIAAQAEKMREAQRDAGGFGEELGDLGDEQKNAEQAAAAHRKELERLDDALAKRGILSTTGLSKKLGELVEILNLASREGTPALRTALAALTPEFTKLAEAARQSGHDVAIVTGIFKDFAAQARLPELVNEMAAWEAANVRTDQSLGEILARLPQTTVAAEDHALAVQVATDAYHEFGLKTPQELRRAADAAVFYYEQLRQSGTATPAQIRQAHEQMVEAVNAATGKIPSYWETTIRPRVASVVEQLQTAVSGSFAQMMLGAKSFKDGFVDIWESIKASVLNILASIADSFINSFLKGLLGAMSGQQGAFSKAFAGLFDGGSGGAGNLLQQTGLGGLFGGGSGVALAGAPGTVTAGLPTFAGVGTPVSAGGTAGLGAGGVPWWSTSLGGGLIGGGAGAAVGFSVGQSTGSAWGGVGSGAATGAGVGAMFGGPIGAGIGALIGGLAGWAGAQRARKQANDDRDAYLQAYADELQKPFVGGTDIGSTFHDLAAELTAATGEAGGGTLFRNLMKANDADELREAIGAVNQALADYRAKTGDAAAADAQHAQALEAKRAEIEQQTAAIREQMKGLDDELARIDASEAPEAHMGTNEKRARARIAAKKAELEAELDAVQAAGNAALEALEQNGTAAAGTVGQAFMEALRTVTSPGLDDLAEGLQTTLPAGASAGAQAVKAAFDRLPAETQATVATWATQLRDALASGSAEGINAAIVAAHGLPEALRPMLEQLGIDLGAVGASGREVVTLLSGDVDQLTARFGLTAEEAHTLQSALAATTPAQIDALGPAFDVVMAKIGLTTDQVALLKQAMVDASDPSRMHTMGEAGVAAGRTIADAFRGAPTQALAELAAGFQAQIPAGATAGVQAAKAVFDTLPADVQPALETWAAKLRDALASGSSEGVAAVIAQANQLPAAVQPVLDALGITLHDTLTGSGDQAFEELGGRWREWYEQGKIMTLGIAGEFERLGGVGVGAVEGIADEFLDIGEAGEDAAQRARDAFISAGKNLPPVNVRVNWKYERPEAADFALAEHATGGLFRNPHLAMIAEGGRPEIIGDMGFMTEALRGALSQLSFNDLALRPLSVDALGGRPTMAARGFATGVTPAAPLGDRELLVQLKAIERAVLAQRDTVVNMDGREIARSSSFCRSFTLAVKENNPPGLRTDLLEAVRG